MPATPPPDPRKANGHDDISEEALEGLRKLARSRPRTGQASLAKASALRALERIDRRRRPLPEMPRDWHPGPNGEWEQLDDADPPEVRQRWFRALHGR